MAAFRFLALSRPPARNDLLPKPKGPPGVQGDSVRHRQQLVLAPADSPWHVDQENGLDQLVEVGVPPRLAESLLSSRRRSSKSTDGFNTRAAARGKSRYLLSTHQT